MSPGDVVSIQPGTVTKIFRVKRHSHFEEELGLVWSHEPLLVLTIDGWACQVLTPDCREGWLKTLHIKTTPVVE